MLQLARKRRRAEMLRVHFQADTLALGSKNGSVFSKPRALGELRVVAQDRMNVERQMGAVEGEIVLESAFEHPPPAAGDRLQARPEQAVVDDEKIYAALDGGVDRRASKHRPPRRSW